MFEPSHPNTKSLSMPLTAAAYSVLPQRGILLMRLGCCDARQRHCCRLAINS